MPDTLPSVPDVASDQPGVISAIWRGFRLSFFLGWQDLRLMYRRSVLGQFWITLSMGVTFGAIGGVFGLIFNSPIVEYLPFLGCGLVFFNFLSLIVNEGAGAFIASAGFIQQLPLSPLVFFMKSVWKAFFVLLHNVLALLVLLAVIPQGISPATLLVIPGVIIAGSAVAGLALALAMLATRYRDVPQIISSAVQVLFYLTPIIWLPQSLPPAARDILLGWNPLVPLLEIMRQPLLNTYPSLRTWAVSLVVAIAFIGLGLASYAWKRRQLAFWVG
jgi:ABC-type polysaccharide/polyol phosphate export permease